MLHSPPATQPDAPVDIGTGTVTGGVRWLLRAEGLLVLLAALGAYAQWGAGWGSFWAGLLLPDLALLGYLAGSRIGALAYNTTHGYAGPLACLMAAQHGGPAWLLPLALVWLAHIGLDRALGYGLKYGTGFAHTHLGWIGRRARKPLAAAPPGLR